MGKDSVLSIEEANELALKHQGWSESIARSVARSWNLDWKLDGLDGAAFEALIFCSRRYDPSRGVPFKGYARKRVHEASTDAARKSKGWRRGAGSRSKSELAAREISAELLVVFPELRSGHLPYDESEVDGDQGTRAAIQQLLMGATMIAARQGLAGAELDELVDYKRMVEFLGALDIIHQEIMWQVYWEGLSLRGVAKEWETDELNVIREHKLLLEFLNKCLSQKKKIKPPRIRPGLRHISQQLNKKKSVGPFTKFLQKRTKDG